MAVPSSAPRSTAGVLGAANEILPGPWAIDPQLHKVFISKPEENRKTLFDKNIPRLTQIRGRGNNEVEKVSIQSHPIRSAQANAVCAALQLLRGS